MDECKAPPAGRHQVGQLRGPQARGRVSFCTFNCIHFRGCGGGRLSCLAAHHSITVRDACLGTSCLHARFAYPMCCFTHSESCHSETPNTQVSYIYRDIEHSERDASACMKEHQDVALAPVNTQCSTRLDHPTLDKNIHSSECA